jgi:hypothetical protein
MIISKQQNGDGWDDDEGDAVGVLSCSGFSHSLSFVVSRD